LLITQVWLNLSQGTWWLVLLLMQSHSGLMPVGFDNKHQCAYRLRINRRHDFVLRLSAPIVFECWYFQSNNFKRTLTAPWQATIDLVANHSVALSLLQEKVRRILGVKYDLGLFEYPFIPEDIDPDALTDQHVPPTLEAARKSIVLLENKNGVLPLDVKGSDVKKYALVGPFSDILNYGDYSGQFGAYPIAHSSTIRQGMLQSLQDANSSAELVSAMGANTWLYNARYLIPGYHLSTVNGTSGGLSATYFADTNFGKPLVHTTEVPVRDWGLYPPPGLPSNNFSAIWEGTLDPSVDIETDDWLGIAIGPNTTAKVYVDEQLLVGVPITTTISGNILSNLPVRSYSLVNGTAPPPGSANFTFQPGTKHKIRIEYQTWNLYQKIENESSFNAEVLLFWNLVDRLSAVQKAVELARDADVIILALGGNWNADGEGGDRGTMSLSANQSALADAIFALDKPVVLILEGGRPFAIPDYYNRSAAVLNSYFGGQTGGQAMADVLFGDYDPGGRIPLTIPRHMGQLPTYYNYKATAHDVQYVDIESAPCYSFGYGLSYSNFSLRGFRATVRSLNASKTSPGTFSSGDIITFSVNVKNTGRHFGSYVPQVYLLQRMSQITQPVKQLVAFTRVYVDPGRSEMAHMDLEVDRYLRMLNRKYEWVLEKGSYTFVLAENGAPLADITMNVTMRCI